MTNDPSAAPEPEAPNEEDYQAFLAALSGSARGRAFLAEHGRRSRGADSAMLLSAVQRLEGLVMSQTLPPEASPSQELRGMIEAIRSVQAELDVSTLATQVARLAALIEGVQQRIETMVTPALAATPPTADQRFVTEENAAGPQPGPVEAVSRAEPAPPPADGGADAAPAIPQVAWCDGVAPEHETRSTVDEAPAAGLAITALVETLAAPSADETTAAPEAKVIKAGTIPPPALFAGEDFSATSRTHLMPPPADPLAGIKALSDDERVALFT